MFPFPVLNEKTITNNEPIFLLYLPYFPVSLAHVEKNCDYLSIRQVDL